MTIDFYNRGQNSPLFFNAKLKKTITTKPMTAK